MVLGMPIRAIHTSGPRVARSMDVATRRLPRARQASCPHSRLAGVGHLRRQPTYCFTQCNPTTKGANRMGAIELNEHHALLLNGLLDLSKSLAERRGRTCAADGLELEADTGRCPACGRIQLMPLDLSSMSDKERADAIHRGVVPATPKGLSEQERKAATFWTRYRSTHPGAKLPAKSKPSRAQRLAEKVIATEILVEPSGRPFGQRGLRQFDALAHGTHQNT